MTYSKLARSGVSTLALGLLLAATPATIDVYLADDGTVGVKVSEAFAKDGRSDREDRSEKSEKSKKSKSDDRGRSVSSGSSSKDAADKARSARDDAADKSRSARDDAADRNRSSRDNAADRARSSRDEAEDRSRDSRDDDRYDDHASRDDGRRGSSPSRRGTSASAGGAGLRVVKIEQSGSGLEIVYSNGIKEEIEDNRYELKNAAGRTVVERSATSSDRSRIERNVLNSGVPMTPGAAAVQPTPGIFSGSQVRRVEVGTRSVEVSYITGWREEIRRNRYELKDPNNNTVVERRATQADVDRLIAIGR